MTFKSVETGRNTGKPFQLFTFRAGDTSYRYTTADKIITIDTLQFLPDQPMESAEIKETNVDDKGKLNFKVMRNHDIANLFLISSPRAISLTIQAGHEGESELVNIWTGRVVACEWGEDDQATLSCESATTILQRSGLPYKFGFTCQHTLYRGGCTLDIFANSILTPVGSVAGYSVTIPAIIGQPDNSYNGGLLVKNEVDYRMITSFDSVTGTVGLIRPFEDLVAGEVIRVALGCNRSKERCIELGNFENFLGFTTIPNRNPFNGLTKAGVIIDTTGGG